MTPSLEALGRQVRERREALGLSIRQAATAAGVTRITWTDIEQAKRARVQRRTLDAIDRGLRQPTGTSASYIGQSIHEASPGERRLQVTITAGPGDVAEDLNAREQLIRLATTLTAYDVHRVLAYVDRLPPPPLVDEYVRAAVAKALAELLPAAESESKPPPAARPRKVS